MHGGTQLSAVYHGSTPIWIAGGAMPTISAISSNGWYRNSGTSGSCIAGNMRFTGECAYNFTSESPDTAEVYFEYYSGGNWIDRYSTWMPAGWDKRMDGVCTGYEYSVPMQGKTLCTSTGGGKQWLNWPDPIRIKIRDENGATDWASTYTDEELKAHDEMIIETYGSFEEYEESCNEGKIDNG